MYTRVHLLMIFMSKTLQRDSVPTINISGSGLEIIYNDSLMEGGPLRFKALDFENPLSHIEPYTGFAPFAVVC